MKLSNVVVALVPLVLATPFTLETRGAALVLKDLKAVNTKVNSLDKLLNKVSKTNGPTDSQLAPLINKSDQISNAISKATNDTNASPQATAAQSKQIYTYVSGTLAPSTIALLQNFIEHEPGFESQSFQTFVAVMLNQQKNGTDGLTAALVKKATKPYKPKGKAVGAKIDKKFDQTIAAYGGLPN